MALCCLLPSCLRFGGFASHRVFVVPASFGRQVPLSPAVPPGLRSSVLPAWSLFGGASFLLVLGEGPTECRFF